MHKGHHQATLQRACDDPGTYLVAAQDTSFFNYSSHPAMDGLGRIQGNIKGLAMHSTMLFSEKGQPLGLLDQHYWSRQGAIDFDGIESDKWMDGLAACRTRLQGCNKHLVLVQDREADVFRFIKAATAPLPAGEDKNEDGCAAQISLLLRVHQPRNLQLENGGQIVRLDQLDHTLTAMERQHSVTVDRGIKQVTLTLSLKATRVHVLADQNKSIGKHRSVALSLVIAREVAAVDQKGSNVFDEKTAAVWFLLTALPIDSHSDIVRILTFYALRWRIERFHYTLKSGALKVEQLQFDDLRTLIHALAFYSVVAWQLLALTYGVRQDEKAPAERYYDGDEMAILATVVKQPIETVGDATRALGRLVGFVPTKRQPYPGVKMLAEALQQLHHMKRGLRIAAKRKPLQD